MVTSAKPPGVPISFPLWGRAFLSWCMPEERTEKRRKKRWTPRWATDVWVVKILVKPENPTVYQCLWCFFFRTFSRPGKSTETFDAPQVDFFNDNFGVSFLWVWDDAGQDMASLDGLQGGLKELLGAGLSVLFGPVKHHFLGPFTRWNITFWALLPSGILT